MAELNELEKATKAYEDISSGYETMRQKSAVGYGHQPIGPDAYAGTPGSYSTPGGALVTIGAPPPDSGVRGQSTGITGRTPGGSGYGSGQVYGQASAAQKNYNPVEFKKPDALKLPGYKPPERDLAEERQLRREYAAPGMSQIRRTTQEAVISSKSIDNPNARALFINKALQGVGSALESVTTGAATQARAESMQRYSTELEKYYTGWKGKAEQTKMNWDADWNAALAEFNQLTEAQMGGFNVKGVSSGGVLGDGGSGWQGGFSTSPRDKMNFILGR